MEVDLHREQQVQEKNQIKQDKKLKCVCELCTCGKHHCPRPRIKGTFSTSYQDNYKNISYMQLSPPHSQYKYQQRHYNPDVMKTSYQDNFTEKLNNNINPESPSRLQNVGNKIIGKIPFTGSSSYKEQFQPFVVKPSAIMQPNQAKEFKVQNPPPVSRSPVRFQGISSYKSQFIQPSKSQSKPIPQQTYRRVNVPFYGNSSYKNDFPSYKFEVNSQKAQELIPTSQKPVVKFEGHTSYNDQFKNFTLQAPKQQQINHECIVEKIHVPPINYINDQNHIFYDPETKKFV